MSYRKSSLRPQRSRRLAPVAARVWQHRMLSQSVESLEERQMLSAVLPGLDDHGVTIRNAQATGLAAINITSMQNARLSNNANGSGLFIELSNVGGALNSLKTISVTGVTIANNGNAGAQIRLTNMTLDNLIIDRAVVTGNGGAGLVLDLTNSTIKNLTIWDSTNNFSPAAIRNPNSGASSYNGNRYDGIHLLGANVAIDSLRIAGNVVQNNIGTGIFISTNVANIASLSLQDNEVRGNAINSTAPVSFASGSGVRFQTNRTNLGYVTSAITFNTIVGNAQHGLSFFQQSLLPGNVPTNAPSNFDVGLVTDNTFNANGGSGLSVDLRQSTTWDATVMRNVFASNSLRGFDLKAGDTVDAFNVQIGGLATNPTGVLVNRNTFTNNLGSAIAIELNDITGDLGHSSGKFAILGNVMTNQRRQNNVYAGEGIRVRIRGDVTRQNGAARIVDSIIDRNTISGNAGDGVRIDVSEDSELTNLLIGNATGPNQTFDVNGGLGDEIIPTQAGDGNVITNNGGNGISIFRLSSAYVKGILILDNIVTGNAEGIYLQASNTFQTVPNAARPNLKVVSDFMLNTNNLSNNRLNGVHLRTEANAVLLADMRYNRIDSNGVNGIHLSGLENSASDAENIGGRWIKNAITNNTSNGISIATVVGSINPLIIGQDGQDLLDQQSLGNFISFNGEDGIDVASRPGLGGTTTPVDIRDAVEIVNNQIIENGKNNVGNPYLAGKGIDIEVLIRSSREFRIDRNTITLNGGDGIELRNAGGLLRLSAVGNFIDLNGGRGVDLLNQPGFVDYNSETFIRFGDKATTLVQGTSVSNRNVITNNGLEGFYVVNTATREQTQDVAAEVALLTTPAVTTLSFVPVNLVLDMENNEIRDNGLGVPQLSSPGSRLTGTGLVIRVGTQVSAGFYGTSPDLTGTSSFFLNNDGSGFFTDNAAAGVGSNVIQGVGSVGLSTFDSGGVRISGNGRVNARIVENEFSGNAGDDVLMESFTSLLPRTTSGEWTETQFRNIGNYDRDPLARLNLEFVGNTGDSVDVVRGWFTPEPTGSYTPGARYNNAEGDFKSRTPRNDASSGPFGGIGATRNRNGQRVAVPALTPGTPPASTNFHYDGLGPSTFRVEGNWDVSGFTDNGLGDDFSEIEFLGNTTTPFGDSTYAWDTVATDTFSFVTAWIDDVSVNEGNLATLTVTLTEDAPVGGVTILYRLSDGTALADPNNDGNTADGDYDPNSVTGSLFIAAGSRTGTITVQVKNDNEFDPGEQFYIDLYQISDGDFVDSRGIVSIRQAPQITITNPEVTEGDNGTKILTYTVNLATDDPTQTISVDYATSNGTATAGQDYATKSGTITFLPGESSKTISIVVNGDLLVEGDETVLVTLSNATGGATLPAPTGTGTILNDDTPSITISDVVVTEGSGNAVFTVSLSKAVDSPVTVQFATANGTALNGQDYTARGGTITFLAGETSKMITVVVLNDNSLETVESFAVNLSNATNGSIGKATGTATINDDDTPAVSIGTPVRVTEEDGTTNMVFTITLSTAAVSPVTVSYATADGTATAGEDYVAKSSSVTFAAGETSKTIVIQILGDRIIEPPQETFTVTLTGDNVAQGTATGIILDDDTPSITIDDVGVLESDGFAFFTVRLSKAVSGSNVSVDFRTTPGTATGGGVDYTTTNGTLVFLPGQTVQTIFVQITQDSIGESIETFFVDLNMPVNATIGDTRGIGRIIDAAFATTLVVAPNTGSPPEVKVYGSNPNVLRFPSFFAYDPSFRGGVRVALGDVNGDGVSDIVTSPASGIAPVRVFDGRSGSLISSFFPYSPNFTGGLSIAADDLNGDGRAEIVVGLASNGSAIRVFNGANGAIIAAYYAFSPGFLGGVNVAVGDVTGDGRSELIVGLASQGSAIRVLQPITGAVLSAFYPFDPSFAGGINVAVGDVNGDGRGEIVAGLASLGSAVRVFDTANLVVPSILSLWQAFPGFSGGVSVGTTDLDFDGLAEVIVAPVAHSTPGTRFFNGLTGQSVASTNPFPSYNDGAWVAGDTLDLVGSPLRLDGAVLARSNAAAVTQAQVNALTEAAIAKFAAAGASADVLAKLANVRFEVGRLPGTYLGLSGSGVVVIDVNAAGRGWFVDSTPNLDEEFVRDANGNLRAVSAQAVGKVDLLSVIVHELAHQLGFDDLNPAIAPNSVLAESLAVSVRRASKENVDDLFADGDLLSELLLA